MSFSTVAQARYTLTCPSQNLAAAQNLADAIDEHFAINAMAVTVNETDETNNLWNTVAYFESIEDAEQARVILKITTAEIAPVPDVDWVRRSLEGLAPVVAGRFYLHGSHDRATRRSGGHSFEIDAGTAFGTGHHGTTAGCLQAFDTILKYNKPKRILDLGCGTGVLALAAARSTSSVVLATDIDPEAVRVTKLNASLNALGPRVRTLTAAGLHHPAIRQAGPYDLIFANILAKPLASLAHGLSGLLLPRGKIILSGLTRDQLRWIAACYRQHGLVPVQTIKIDNWVALVVTKPNSSPKTKNPRTEIRGQFVAGAQGPGWEEA
jgi:ribosomal protein L11 methyltransferase